MNFLDSNVISAFVGGIMGVGGLIAYRIFFPGKERAETGNINSEALHRDLAYVTTERDRYRDLWHKSEINVEALKQMAADKESNWAHKFKELEDRCQHLEDTVAKLTAGKL